MGTPALLPRAVARCGVGTEEHRTQNLGGLVFSPSTECAFFGDLSALFGGQFGSTGLAALQTTKAPQLNSGRVLLLERFSRRHVTRGLIYNGLGEQV